ncbi:putative bifunctional diguanylate cyclase/phosphodiesterase [Marinimicrobium alkaliphilum]|uniref:putative bifunctional diguanylate cyclase/phosphodiesterase n=1 Tax=Marinimicrobium alkaliphilum TaxID=2202654 RepID=UPI0018E0B38A|nr:EAL domain-containing protein [Marinimicrobium alkaliphilum]
MTVATSENQAKTDRSRRFHRFLEAPVLIGALALIGLSLIWSATFHLTSDVIASASRNNASMTTDVAQTYEAQVVRALREIDQTLKLVRYDVQRQAPEAAIDDLNEQDLLPPSLLFSVAVLSPEGNLLATHGRFGLERAEERAFFQRALRTQQLTLSRPIDTDVGAFLYFARGMTDEQGRDSGVVTLAVHAEYFVSGYDSATLGEAGLLGLAGDDDNFRVYRTGDKIGVGTSLGVVAREASGVTDSSPAPLVRHPWDQVERYTVVRELFEFPLSVVIGLSHAEQLAPARATVREYYWRAVFASGLLIGIAGILGFLSWRLQKERQQATEERVQHAQKVEYLAFHDSLTDLPNRAYFSRLLTQSMLEARRYERQFALLFLDLDRFKHINDSLGHDAGDELLQEIARRLACAVRESDVVARLGGDEFVVLLPNIADPQHVSPVADKILAACAKPFTLVGQEFRVTVSIGITLFPRDGDDEQTLMKNADMAMYHAKALGKNNFQFFSESLSDDSLERLTLESSLRHALERQEFRLYYQPKRNMKSGDITGVEALLRWAHPELGMILPMQFIPVAEENGLIVPIGRWVFHTACQQSVDWQANGMPPLSMAINLSARQFIDEHLLDDIKLALEETGMNPDLLELEITESMVMRDVEATVKILKELKAMGVRVAIDDFGTGYSSLSTLKQFPVDTIKIDASFIHDLTRSLEDRGLTEAIIAVGRSLSLNVIAEGVETSEQYEFLQAQACDEFQGFYGNEALPAEEFSRLIASIRSGRS